jgi:predicted acetyltransferase
MSVHVQLAPLLPEDRPALASLLQLYLHDFSELLGDLPRADGRFDAGPLERFGTDSGQHAFLIRCDAALAGFALAALGSRVSGDPSVMDVAEFFVVRGARRTGVGRAAACALFARFPGAWEVRVMRANERALAFWRDAVGVFARGGVAESSWTAPSGRPFAVLRFESPARELAFRPVDFARYAAECVRFKRDAYACSFGTDALFDEHFRDDAGYLAWLRTRSAIHLWRDGEIVGQLELAPRPDPEPSSVTLFYLVESARGTGAGDALHAHVVALLRTHGSRRADLHVAPGNTRAVRYYLKHGWRDLGPEPNGAVHRMRLELA